VTEDRARASLRSAICQVRQIAPDLLVCNGSVHLGRDVYVDTWSLDKAGHRVMAGVANDPTDRTLRRTCERELLPDWDDEWLVPERDRLQQLRLRVLEGLACAAVERGLYGLAIDHCLAALRVDPLRETAHRALIRTHLAEGNPAAALRAYRECVDVLDSEFGIEPTEETNDLVRMVIPAARWPLPWHQVTHGVHSLASALSVMATSMAV
jgi:DNA-binding SARP family transcriptional activator